MTKEEFLQGICYIKAYYPNWNFNVQDGFVSGVWYDNLKELDMESYQTVIKDYCSKNRFPPQSPFDILEMVPKEYSKEDAWEIIFDCIRRSKDTPMFLNLVYKQYPKLYPFVKHFNIEQVETDDFGNKCYGYSLGKLFKRNYQSYLDSIKIKLIKSSRKLLV